MGVSTSQRADVENRAPSTRWTDTLNPICKPRQATLTQMSSISNPDRSFELNHVKRQVADLPDLRFLRFADAAFVRTRGAFIAVSQLMSPDRSIRGPDCA